MNELDSAIFHFFAIGAPARSVWANAPVIAVPATANTTSSTVSAPLRAIQLFRVIACKPPPQSIPPERCRASWARLLSLARTTPSSLPGRVRRVRADPPCEGRLPVAQALLDPAARLVAIAALDRGDDVRVVHHHRGEVRIL